MKIPPVPLCFEPFNGFFQCFIWISPALPRKLGQLCGENSGLPTLCTDGWKGKGALAEGRAAAGEGHYLYIYIYMCVCARWKIWGCNVVNPCKPNHRPPILEALSIGWGRKWSDDWRWWPLAWVKRIPPNVWKIPGIAELHMQKLLCFPCVLQTIENARVFLGEKHADVVSCGKLFTIFASFSEAAVFPVFLLRGK